MTYAIGHLVYGYDLTDIFPHLKERWDPRNQNLDCETPEEFYDLLTDGLLEAAYSGNARDQPMWLGVELGTINECGSVRIADLPRVPTPEQVEELRRKMAALPDWLQALVQERELAMWIIWGTS